MDYKLSFGWWTYTDESELFADKGFLDFYASQLARAIFGDDAVTLKDLLDTYGGIGLVDSNEESLLHFTVRRGSRKAFKVLIETQGIHIDAITAEEMTPLHYSTLFYKEDIAIKLIHKGADIHLINKFGESALHLAIQQNDLQVAVLLIERGIDIDCCDNYGKTPLAIAYEYNLVEAVNMLLFYGARADTSLLPIWLNMDPDIRESASDFIFDEHKDPVSWKIFADACTKYMKREKNQEESFFFGRFLDSISEITYVELSDLEIYRLNWKVMFEIEPKHFLTILKNVENCLNFVLSRIGPRLCSITNATILENWTVILNSNKLPSQHVLDRIGFTFPCDQRPTADFRKKVADLILLSIDKGVYICQHDVSEVYSYLGYSSIFKRMLRDYNSTVSNVRSRRSRQQHLMAELIYDVKMTLDNVMDNLHYLNEYYYYLSTFDQVLDHFSNQRFNQYCSTLRYDSVKKKVKKMPQIPHLAELARNKARKHIIDFFQLENFRSFDDTVEKLDISVIYKKMLTYELKLY